MPCPVVAALNIGTHTATMTLLMSKRLPEFYMLRQILKICLERKAVQVGFIRAMEFLKSCCVFTLLTGDLRKVKSQLITCHRDPALHWDIFISVEIAMPFHPPLARLYFLPAR